MIDRSLLPVILITGFVIFTGVIARAAAAASRKAQENMKRLAEQLRLTPKSVKPVLGFYGSPEANGVVRGKPVRLYNFTTGSGKSRRTWSALEVWPSADGGLTFTLARQGVGTKLKELFGAREIQVGEASFDRDWFIETNQPDFLAAALLPEIQQKLQPLTGKWKLEKGQVTYVEEGLFANDQRCVRFAAAVDAACDLADIAEVHARQAMHT